ncbi:putative solute carrier family 23 member 1 [Apostichopus japonicus]|uniref:Putative solute carrier family 23 member 1 n=1 Tax=Stichopus japonicus TaxID=307972 RepID=A0A2G8K596_STIJA|nr:putative solute carrier family 23 member 1 [Apostichopus japonicus]
MAEATFADGVEKGQTTSFSNTEAVTTNGTTTANSRQDTPLSNSKRGLTYDINESPVWYISILLGFQHYLTMFGSTLGIPLLLSVDLCMVDNPVDIGKLIQTEFFVSGLATILQTTFGNRLPIVQGASISFLGPAQAILQAQGPCLDRLTVNSTAEEVELRGEFWRSRMQLLQGAILVACLVEIIVGFTGLIGFLLRFIGPLTIAPTLCLIGLSLFGTAGRFAGGNWILAWCVVVLMTLFSQYLTPFSIPVPGISTEKRFRVVWFPVFKLLPVILAIIAAWVLAAILTATDQIPEGTTGRTDFRATVLRDSPWFYIPYPFQWGVPFVTLAGVFGMIAGVLASMVESIGDYFACARVSGAPPPPNHAQPIRVGSRRVVQASALFMIILGSFGKFGAFFATIPIPIIGGMFFILFGLVAAVGLSSLQFVDLNSSRNLFVLGSSLFIGLALPSYMNDNKGAINTRSAEFNQIVTVLLSTNMFVGGVIAAFLDNTIPGTDEERGIIGSRASYGDQSTIDNMLKCYDMPFGMKWIRSVKFFEYIPCSPTFKGFIRRKQDRPVNGTAVEVGVTNDAMVIILFRFYFNLAKNSTSNPRDSMNMHEIPVINEENKTRHVIVSYERDVSRFMSS